MLGGFVSGDAARERLEVRPDSNRADVGDATVTDQEHTDCQGDAMYCYSHAAHRTLR